MDRVASTADGVAGWRERRLRAAGVDAQLAARLARDPRFDVHAVIQLVERGCDPRIAGRIVAPIDPGAGGEAA